MASPIGTSILEGLSMFSASTIHEVCPNSSVLPHHIRPIWQGARVVGPAFTVSQPSGYNDWLHAAIYSAPPHSILVATPGDDSCGYWGELMSRAAKKRSLGGLVISGGVRDVAASEALAFPVFASAISPRGTKKSPRSDGSFSGSVAFGDVEVRSGDLIVGDRDGVVAIPAEEARGVLVRAAAREAREERIRRQIETGGRLVDLLERLSEREGSRASETKRYEEEIDGLG